MDDVFKESAKRLNGLEDLVTININDLSESSKEIGCNNAYNDKQKASLKILLEKHIGGLVYLKNSIKAMCEELESVRSRSAKNISVKQKVEKGQDK